MDLPSLLDEVPFGYLLARPSGEVLGVNRVLRTWLAREAEISHIRELFDVAGQFYFETHIGPLLRMQGLVEEIAIDLKCGSTLIPAILNARLVAPAGAGGLGRLHFAVLKATDRRAYEQELLLARRRTEEALELAASYASDMEHFAHLASHDLQAPLRRIAQHLAFLRQAIAENDTAELERCLSGLARSTARGQELIGALLRYAKSRSVPLTPSVEQIDVIVRDVATGAEDTQGARITVDLPPIEAACDGALIRRVFENLVGNALKYHKPGVAPVVRIATRTKADRDEIGISVTDEGIGFGAEHARSIFEPFTRLVRYEDYEGTGVGLALVQSVLMRHGWSIEAVSAPGQGATFTVWIPRKALGTGQSP